MKTRDKTFQVNDDVGCCEVPTSMIDDAYWCSLLTRVALVRRSLPECDVQHAWLNCMERGSIHCDTLPEGEFSSSFESCVWPCIVCTIKCILSHKHLHLIFSVCLPLIGAF